MKDTSTWILVVDDREENRILLREYLDELNVNIDEAESGSVCLEKLKQKEYTLVILDVQMPYMDGYTVLDNMRASDEFRNIPVILVSTVFSSEEHVLRGIEGGAIDFIVKPINHDILTSKVNNFIRFYERQKKLDQMIRSLEEMNQRLRENERKFKRITQSASDAIILLDHNRCVRYWNLSAQRIFGYNKFEVISMDLINLLISEKSKQSLLDHFSALESNPDTYLSSIRLNAINNLSAEFPVELSLASFPTADESRNYTVIIRDISHQVKTEKEALLAKELKESNKVMKEFMDNVSHELRTPMNAIMGISNMLLKYNSDNLSKKQKEGLQIISQSGTRLLDLINDVLDLSRIEANREAVKIEKFSLDQLLASLNSTMISLIGTRDLKFQIRKSTMVPELIETDPKKLHQILLNLLSNAVKFTQKGKILLFIHLIEDKLYFEVSDTGIGIEEKNLGRIFLRFQQIDNTASKEYKGTGLGLHIVKNLIELMKGEIRAESTPGKGTTMKFYIPVGVKDTGIPLKNKKGTTACFLWTDIVRTTDKLALIIDYSSENHFLFANLLKEAGFMVASCYESKKAVAAITEMLPDLIIINMEMPKIHGSVILDQLANNNSVKDTPILAFTSVEELEIEVTGLNLYLVKAVISEHVLLDAIGELKIGNIVPRPCQYMQLYETKNSLKKQSYDGLLVLHNDSYETALLSVCRRKVRNLILDGFTLHGENIKLVRALKDTCNVPDKIFIISSKPFELMMEDLKKLSYYKLISLSEAQAGVSLEKMLES